MASENITLYRVNDNNTDVIEQLPKTIISNVYDYPRGQFLDRTIQDIQTDVQNIVTSTQNTTNFTSHLNTSAINVHTANQIAFTPPSGMTSTSVQSAIQEVFQAGNNVKSSMVDALLFKNPSLPISSSNSWQQIINTVGSNFIANSSIKNIQRINQTLPPNTTSGTITINAVDTNSAVIRVLSIYNQATNVSAILYRFTNSTSIAWERYAASASNIVISIEVIEFNNVRSLQRHYSMYASAVTGESSSSISTINASKSLIFYSTRVSSALFTPEAFAHKISVSNNTLYFTKGYTDINTYVHIEIIEFM